MINFIKEIYKKYKKQKNEPQITEENTDKTILKEQDENVSTTNTTSQDKDIIMQHREGKAYAFKIIFDEDCIDEIKNKYIAFDVETTGLNPQKDKIVEVGAVLFENGIAKDHFQSLVNPKMNIPEEVTKINGITNEMLASAPDENYVYKKLCEFLGGAIHQQIALCAHNAKFDMDFLCMALRRNGIDADIYYLDTLELSRKIVKKLDNYKQSTVAEHFQIEIKNAHRACDDARVCGEIMKNLIEVQNKKIVMKKEKRNLSDLEEEICKYLQNIIVEKGGNVDYLRFQRLSSGHIVVSYLYNFLRFKYRKSKYIIIPEKEAKKLKIETKECTKSEGDDVVRYYFENKEELDILSDYIYKEFKKSQRAALSYMKTEENFYKAIQVIEDLIKYDL